MVWSTIPFLLVELVKIQINDGSALFAGSSLTADKDWSKIPRGMLSRFYSVLSKKPGEDHRVVKYTSGWNLYASNSLVL